MRFPALVVAAALAGLFAGIGDGLAQQAGMGCKAEQPPGKPQILRCGGGLTIIAENGADFTLLDRDHDGRIDGIDLRSKAVFIDAPKKKSGRQFEVTTPQAIAAVRGTKWAVDAAGSKTSVFVDSGRVSVLAETRATLRPTSATMRRSCMSAMAPAAIEIKRVGSSAAVCTSATMSADEVNSVIAQAAPTPWISRPRFDSRPAIQIRRKTG